MKGHAVIFWLLFSFGAFSQGLKLSILDKNVLKYPKYSIEDSIVVDSIYLIEKWALKKDINIYYDKNKTTLATSIAFDTIKGNISVNHYNKRGHKIKQVTFPIDNKKNFKNVFETEMLRNYCTIKNFIKDTACIYEIIYSKTSVRGILKDTNNQVIQTYEELSTYGNNVTTIYKDEFIEFERIRITYDYYFYDIKTNKGLKKITEQKSRRYILNKTGDEVETEVWNVIRFDKNGCIIDG